jgi:Ion channel
VLLIVLVLNLIAAAMVLEFERGNPAATIDSYPDALWWAVTTITTVGYGTASRCRRPAGQSRSCS